MSLKLALLLTLLAAVGFGCGKGSTYKTKDGEVTVDKQGSQVTYEAKTKEGKVKVTANEAGVTLPDTFPKDVPVYKGAVVKMTAAQDKTTIVQLHLPASVADGAKYYQEELKNQGWNIETTMNMGDGSMVMAKKGSRQCSVVLSKDGNESAAQIAVTQEK
jgi:hypothetical protein